MLGVLGEGTNDVAEGRQGLIDRLGFLQRLTLRARLVHHLRASEIDEEQLPGPTNLM